MRALKFITGHVIFKLRYNEIYQMKITQADSEAPVEAIRPAPKSTLHGDLFFFQF